VIVPASRRVRAERVGRRYAPDDFHENDTAGDDAVDEDFLDEEEEPACRPARARSSRRLTAVTAGRAGLRYITELTGKGVEGVTMVKPAGDGWTVEVEVVEDHRVPSSGDTLAIYAVDLDSEGDLVSYRRVRSYKRARGDTGGVS
jgi:hypothetical protein